ncbi:unnamed protein product [marine sediment metagenome]|uniref:Uncharacterized protein n=1 Tax=marine sediment metagenome TaxID=412755 RepID=X1QJE6_9ZZZZ
MINKLSPDEKKSALFLSPLQGGKIPYILDENLRFRPEPGFDDGSPAGPLDKCWNDPEPWAPETPPEQLPLIEQYINDISDLGRDEWLQESYLEHLTQTHIPICDETPEFDLKSEMSTPEKCSKVYNSLYARLSTNLYHVLLHCMKFWCEKCGGKKKKIHKRRKKLTYRKINRGKTIMNRAEIRAAAGRWVIRQFVFTVPEKDRYRFMSREGLNKLFGVARRTIKDLFPGSRVHAYMHTVGDKDLLKFNPHVNVHIFLPKGEGVKLKLSPEILDAVKDRFARGLRNLGCSDIRGPGESITGKMVDVHYSYASKGRKVLHKINYMTRPLGPEHLEAWRQNIDGQKMIDLHVQELKGFQYMRSWDRWAGCNYYDTESTIKEVESVIGEPVEHIGFTPASDIQKMITAGILEKIGEDLYMQRSKVKRNRSP